VYWKRSPAWPVHLISWVYSLLRKRLRQGDLAGRDGIGGVERPQTGGREVGGQILINASKTGDEVEGAGCLNVA